MEESPRQRLIIPEQFFICGLCGATYNEPKQLGCLHSFCRTCLVQYMRNLRRKNASVECPTCQMHFEESNESFKDLPDDSFIKLLLHLSTVESSDNSGQDPNNYDMSVFEAKRNQCKNKLRALKIKSHELCHDLVDRNRSNANLKERLTVDIKSYFSDLTFAIVESLKQQEMKAIKEVNTLVAAQRTENEVKISWCRSVVEQVDNKDQLLGNMDSEMCNSFPFIVIVCLLTELNKQLVQCEETLNGLGVSTRTVQFAENNDEREQVLGFKFGTVSENMVDIAPENTRPACVHLSPDGLLVPGNRSSACSDICYGLDVANLQDVEEDSHGAPTASATAVVTENDADQTPAVHISNISAPEIIISSTQSTTSQHFEEHIENITGDQQNDNLDQSGSGDATPMTEVPSSPASENIPREQEQLDSSQTDEILDAILSQTNTAAGDEEQLPSYWDVAGENVAGHRFNTINRSEQTPSNNSNSGEGSTGDDVTVEFRSRTSSTSVFAASPLKYAKHVRSITVQAPDDRRVGPVVGIACLHNLIVVIDRWNSKVKLFNDTGEFIAGLFFADGDPWDVVTTHLVSPASSVALCAVTVPRQKVILQLTVDGSGLQITNRITTPSGYSCLSYDKVNSAFICGVSQPFGQSQVDVISLDGQMLACFAFDPQGRQLFSHVRSLDVLDNGLIAVCDWKKNCVFFLRPDGTVATAYTGTDQCPLIEPTGTTSDGRGYLMISDSKSGKVHIVDKNGKFYGIMKSNCPMNKVKEINIRPYGPPMLALSHGKYYIELFKVSMADITNLP